MSEVLSLHKVVLFPHVVAVEGVAVSPLLLAQSYTLTELGYIFPEVKFAFIPELISPLLKQTRVTLCHCKIQY